MFDILIIIINNHKLFRMKLSFGIPLCLLILLASLPAFSQNIINGSVIDQASNPVAFANVVLLSAADSTTVYRGAVTNEDGTFSFEKIESNDYLLAISFVGYENFYRRILINGNTDLEPVILKEEEAGLTEVTIKARKPKITRSVDRIVFDVENSMLSTGSSWDILRKTPGVVVSGGQLMVRNGIVAIYINDRKVQLTADELRELLESYSAANIKSVEVITNPPARYEAEGGAILNIVTSTNLTPGYKGSVQGNYTQAIFPKYQIGTNHYFKTDKLNLFAGYTFSPRKEFKNDKSLYNFFDQNNRIYSSWETDFERTTRSRAHNASMIMDYNFNERNILSISSNVMISPRLLYDNYSVTEARNAQNQLDSTFVTQSSLKHDPQNLALDLKYTHKLAKPGAEISFNTHYTHYTQEREQIVSSRYFSPQGQQINRARFDTDAAQQIDIFTGQIDFTSPWGNANFETGVKSSLISSESGIRYFGIGANLVSPGLNISENFIYDELIHAGYISLSREWDAWSGKVGLRGEYTDIDGISDSEGAVNNQEYFELFPTFYLQRVLSENHILTFDYSRRITRPKYENLNPFRYYLNENDFNAGNPDLRAGISNNFNLNYTLKGQYFFDLYYRDNGETPEVISFQDNVNRTVRRLSTNLLESLSYGLDISHQRSITNFWFAYGVVSLFHEENTFLAVESNNRVVTNEIDAFYSSIYNSFTLSRDGSFTGELTFLHISGLISGSYQLDPWTTVSLGFRKTLWNNRAELSLNVEDIFNTTNTRLISQYLNQDNSYAPIEETRFVRLGFKYNFGNFRLQDNQRSIQAAERDRI